MYELGLLAHFAVFLLAFIHYLVLYGHFCHSLSTTWIALVEERLGIEHICLICSSHTLGYDSSSWWADAGI